MQQVKVQWQLQADGKHKATAAPVSLRRSTLFARLAAMSVDGLGYLGMDMWMEEAIQDVVKGLPPCSGQLGSVAAPLFGNSACCLSFVCHCCLLLPAEVELKLSAATAAS